MTLDTVEAIELLTHLTPEPSETLALNNEDYVREACRCIVLVSAVGHLLASDHPTPREAMNCLNALDMIRLIANALHSRGQIIFPQVSSVELIIGSPES